MFDTIKECRAFEDIYKMEQSECHNGDEVVIVYVKQDYPWQFTINVTADSGKAMISDIIKGLRDRF